MRRRRRGPPGGGSRRIAETEIYLSWIFSRDFGNLLRGDVEELGKDISNILCLPCHVLCDPTREAHLKVGVALGMLHEEEGVQHADRASVAVEVTVRVHERCFGEDTHGHGGREPCSESPPESPQSQRTRGKKLIHIFIVECLHLQWIHGVSFTSSTDHYESHSQSILLGETQARSSVHARRYLVNRVLVENSSRARRWVRKHRAADDRLSNTKAARGKWIGWIVLPIEAACRVDCGGVDLFKKKSVET